MKKYFLYLSASLVLFLCSENPPNFIFNLKDVTRWLLQVEIPFYRGVGRQRGRGFGALAQVFWRTAIPFLRKYIVPAAKRVGADLLDFAVPEIIDFVSG